MAMYDKNGNEIVSDEELEWLTEALIKFSAESETGWFEHEKRLIDSTSVGQNENMTVVKEDMYAQLLRKIQNAIDRGKDRLC